MPIATEINPYLAAVEEEENPYLTAVQKEEENPYTSAVLTGMPIKHEPPQVTAPSKYSNIETPAPGTPEVATMLGLQETTTDRAAPETKMVEQIMERRHEADIKRLFPEKGGPTDPDFEEARNWIKAAKNAGIDMTTTEGVVEFSNFIGNLGVGIARQPEGMVQMVKTAQQDPVGFAKETGIWLGKGVQYIAAQIPGAHLKKGTAETKAEFTEAMRTAPVETAMQVTWPLAAVKGAVKVGGKFKGRGAPTKTQPLVEQITPELEAKMREVSPKPKEAPDALQGKEAQAPKAKVQEVAPSKPKEQNIFSAKDRPDITTRYNGMEWARKDGFWQNIDGDFRVTDPSTIKALDKSIGQSIKERPFTAQTWNKKVTIKVTPSTSQKGYWQITQFAEGEPIGHTTHISYADAVRVAESQYRISKPTFIDTKPKGEKGAVELEPTKRRVAAEERKQKPYSATPEEVKAMRVERDAYLKSRPADAMQKIQEEFGDKTVSTKEFKGEILDQIDQAVAKAAKEKDFIDAHGNVKSIPTLEFEIPGDGKFKINNTKEALTFFRKKVSALRDKAAVPKPYKPPKPKKEFKPKPDFAEKLKAKGVRVDLSPKKKPGASVELGFMGTPEAYRQLGESVVTGARKVAEVANDIVKAGKVPESVKPGLKTMKEAMGKHHTEIRKPELLTYLFENEFKKAVPDKARQELILHSLQQRRKHKGYTELTPQEQGVLKWVELEADRLAKYVKDNEILAEGITDQFSEQGNRYLFQWWRDPTGKAQKSKYGKFAKTAPQFKQRTYETYEAGIAAGKKPVTTNVGRIIGETWQSVVRAYESQEMHNTGARIELLDANMQMKRSKGGQPKPARFIEKWANLEEAGLADDYVRETDHFWNQATTYTPAEGGKPAVISRQPIGIHKELYPFWKAYKDSPTYGNFAKFVFTTKSMKLLSFFHPAQLALNQAATGRVPFTGLIKGQKLWKSGNETIRLLHKHGLEMPGRYEDINYGDLLKFKKGTSKVQSVAATVGNVLLKPAEWNAKLIFNLIQPGMKTAFAYGKFNKLRPKYVKKGLSMDVLARDVVKAADNFFSGEDYKRAMLETNKYMARYYFSAGARKGWQMSLISPTWQRENIILVKNVLKSMMPEAVTTKMGMQPLGPSASIYRNYAGAAVGLYGISNLYNWMATKEMDGKGKMMWENAKPFGVRMLWNSPAYTTTDKNGKERKHPGGKPVFWRPFKTIVEVPEFFFGEQDKDKGKLSNVATSMVKKTGYKIAPWLAATAKMFFGYQYSNPSAWERVKDWGINVFAPISVMQASDWVEGKKNPQDALGAFFGMPSGTISATEFKQIFYERWGYARIAEDEDEMKLVIKQWRELPGMGKFNRTKAIDTKNKILKEQEEEL